MILLLLSTTLEEIVSCVYNVHIITTDVHARSLQASEGDTKISIDPSLHHHQRLEEANRGLDNVLSHGADILGNLKDQRFTLKVKLHAHM